MLGKELRSELQTLMLNYKKGTLEGGERVLGRQTGEWILGIDGELQEGDTWGGERVLRRQIGSSFWTLKLNHNKGTLEEGKRCWGGRWGVDYGHRH